MSQREASHTYTCVSGDGEGRQKLVERHRALEFTTKEVPRKHYTHKEEEGKKKQKKNTLWCVFVGKDVEERGELKVNVTQI